MKVVFYLWLILATVPVYGVIIAHRGAPGYLPEHTLAGVALAHSWGVDFIEPDIVLTKDGEAVVLHDIHLDTTTNVAELYSSRKRGDGRYYAIDFTLKEIKKLSVMERFNHISKKAVFPNRFRGRVNGFKVPTLREYISVVKELNRQRKKRIGIYPEIKSPEFHQKHGKDIVKVVFEILKEQGYNDEQANIYVQCFYPPALKRLRLEFKAKMKLTALIAENSWNESSINYNELRTEKGIKSLSKYVVGVGPYINHLYIKKGNKIRSTGLVKLAHKYGLKVHPYTHRTDSLPNGFKNESELLRFLFEELKVDGVFSDFADRVKQFLQKKGA